MLPRADIARYARIALAVYGEAAPVPVLLEEEGLTVESMTTVNGLLAATCWDGGQQILAIRGTADWRNVLQDIDAKLTPSTASMPPVHEGFLGAYKSLERFVTDECLGMRPIVIGHSLGGAIALLAAVRVIPRQVVTFGCPRVGLRPWRAAYEMLAVPTLRVVHELDLVPRVPLDWEHVGESLVLNEEGTALEDEPQGQPSLHERIIADLDGESLSDHRMAGYVSATERFAAVPVVPPGGDL